MTAAVAPLRYEPVSTTETSWSRVCKPLAAVVDAVMPASREGFELLLQMVANSPFSREAWTVLRLIRLADDPLASIGTLAREALRSWEQLGLLCARDDWSYPNELVSKARSTALLNLAVAVRQGDYQPAGFGPVNDPTEHKLELAAAREKADQQTIFVSLASLRSARAARPLVERMRKLGPDLRALPAGRHCTPGCALDRTPGGRRMSGILSPDAGHSPPCGELPEAADHHGPTAPRCRHEPGRSPRHLRRSLWKRPLP